MPGIFQRLSLAGLLLLAIPTLAFAQSALPVCEPSTLDKLAGLITLTNIMWTGGAIMGVFCAAWLIILMWPLLMAIPLLAYEVIGYGLSGLAVYFATKYTGGMHNALLLAGSLFFGAMVAISGKLRKAKPNEAFFFGLLFVVWSAIAWSFQNEYVGFVAVMALMASLGFSGGVIPGFGYFLGFSGEGALGRATAAAFVVLGLFVLDRILVPQSVMGVKVFEQGALWMGSFVGYLGLLIASSRWYDDGPYPYIVRNLVMVSAGVAAIAVGSVFNISPLLGIGGTFLGLWLIEKPFDAPRDSASAYAFTGLCVAIFLWFAAGWIENNRDMIGPYILF